MNKIKEDLDIHGVNFPDYNLNGMKLDQYDLDKKLKGVQLSDYNLGKVKKIKDPSDNLKYSSETKIGEKLGLPFDITKNIRIRSILRTLPAYKSTREVMSNESVELLEKHLSDAQMSKREEIVKAMKDSPEKIKKLKDKYGERWKEVAYATATKLAMKEDIDLFLEKFGDVEMDTKKLKAKFSALGWRFKRSGGDHEIWDHPKAKHILSIPMHREQNKMLAKKLIRQANDLQESEHTSRSLEIIKEVFIDKKKNQVKSIESKIASLTKPKTKSSSDPNKSMAIKTLHGGRTLTGNVREPLHISPKINRIHKT